MASPSGCRCYPLVTRHVPTACLWWFSWLSRCIRVRSTRSHIGGFPHYAHSLARCSSYRLCIHPVSDVDLSHASGVQKAFDTVQRIDPARGHRLLRVALIFRIEAGGRYWHCPTHICEFLSRQRVATRYV